MQKLRLTSPEKHILRSAEANPIDYTLCDAEQSMAYVKALLKVLAEASGASGPSSKVSRQKEELNEQEALGMLYTDPMGVVTHYAITKLYDVVNCLREKRRGAVSIGTTFYNEDGNLIDEWRPLLRVLHLGGGGDAFAQRGAAYCLAFILMAGCPSQRFGTDRSRKINHASVEEPLAALISWITSQLQSSASSSLSLVTPTLTALMSCPEARILFANSGGIGYLSRHLRTGSKGTKRAAGGTATVQQLYELCFCLWTLTYECNTSSSIRTTFARDNAVHSLVDLVSSAPREKVIRVALSALRTLATCTPATPSDSPNKKDITSSTFLNEMIGCGLIKYIDQMKERQWTDPDIVDDLTVLHKLLHENFKEMSRWDVYLAEVQSGSLEWGILHTEKFFKENARRFEGPNGDFSVVKVRARIMISTSEYTRHRFISSFVMS
jgi:V-type H+-transporting ATPase subunit H